MTADDMPNECLRCWLVGPLLPHSLDSLNDPTSGAHGEETSWDSVLLDGSSRHHTLALDGDGSGVRRRQAAGKSNRAGPRLCKVATMHS